MADKSFWSDKKDKTWFKNFWYYYKIHVCVLIVVIIVMAFTIRDCATRIEPDISIDFVSEEYLSTEVTDRISQYFAEKINDVDQEDGSNVTVVQHTVIDPDDKNADVEMAVAIQQSILVELTVGESYLYILDDSQFETFKDSEILYDLSEITDLPKGTYSITINDNKLFKELTQKDFEKPLHLCVRTLTPSLREKELPRAKAEQENAIIIFNEFYKNNEVTE